MRLHAYFDLAVENASFAFSGMNPEAIQRVAQNLPSHMMQTLSAVASQTPHYPHTPGGAYGANTNINTVSLFASGNFFHFINCKFSVFLPALHSEWSNAVHDALYERPVLASWCCYAISTDTHLQESTDAVANDASQSASEPPFTVVFFH